MLEAKHIIHLLRSRRPLHVVVYRVSIIGFIVDLIHCNKLAPFNQPEPTDMSTKDILYETKNRTVL